MSMVKISDVALSSANPQVVSLTGKTTGRDLWMLFAVPATPTLPANWVEHGSLLLDGGAFYLKLWRLPAASNTAGVTQASIALNGPVGLVGCLWEDTELLDTGTTVFFAQNPAGASPTGATPALWGTGLHTFTSRTNSFAWFVLSETTTRPTWDLVSYDSSYTEWSDSGYPASGSSNHLWLARKSPDSMSDNGVTATSDGAKPALNGFSGMFAYSTVAATNPTISLSTASLTFNGTAGAASPATQTVALSNVGAGTLNFTVSDDAAWLSVSPTSGTAPQTLTVTADPGALGAGTVTGTITVAATGATNTPQTISVTFNVAASGTAPSNSVAPAITGTLTTGGSISCSNGTWSGTATITYAFQWKRNNTNIAGATSSAYTLQEADEGQSIKCTVTATNGVGSASADSNTVSPLDEPVNSVAPAITGTTQSGQTISCSTGTWTNSPTAYAYQWKRAGSNIAGATNSTYLLVGGDVGQAIKCTVTASNANGSGTPTDSNTVTPTAPGTAPTNSVAPAISGTALQGQTLTCSTGTWSGDPTITYAYQWKRGASNIAGATASTYLLVLADVGQSVKCTVTATNGIGSNSADSNTVTPSSNVKLTIAQENALTGSPNTEWEISGAGDASNQGFCREFSLNVGEVAHFSCHGTGTVIDIYRCGWYGGSGFSFKQRLTNTPTTQPGPQTVANTNGGVNCTNWSTTASWTIPANATPGLYIGVFRNLAGNDASWIPFVVRDDSRTADIMYKTSDATWALAYNYFGAMGATVFQGKSVYGSGGPVDGATGITGRAHYTSYHKPIITRQGVSQTYWYNAEAPMIRYLERMGFDVTYTASKDWREGSPVTPAACKIYVSCGHDEYWDQGMRDAWEGLRNAGKHLIFASGNEVFWRTRFADGGDSMYCYKDTMAGPGGHVAGVALDPVSWTGTWKDTRWVGRKPENTITGTDFRLNGLNSIALAIGSTAAEGDHTFWRSTDVGTAGFTSGAGIIGFEADEALPTQPSAQVTYMARQTFAATGIYADANGQNYDGTKAAFDYRIVSQRYSSGAVVVGFGSCQWSWGLDASHDRGANVANSRIQQATANLLRDMGAAAPATLISGLTSPTPQSLDNYGILPAPPAEDTATIRLHRRTSTGEWQRLVME